MLIPICPVLIAESFNKIALACRDIFLETEHDAKDDKIIKQQTFILKMALRSGSQFS